MKKCKDFCDKLSDYLDKELGENECVLIEEHLDSCAPCSLIFEGLKIAVLVCS
ncbi:MAG: anti-sigma factor family protein, partial [Desulfomonilaceae bacterium]